jgi:hypothetical protein
MASSKRDEKFTVYCSNDEAIEIDQALLELRKHGIKTDRGALVREALSLAVPELLSDGSGSRLYRSLAAKRADSGIPEPALR